MIKTGTVVKIDVNIKITVFNDNGLLVSVDVQTEDGTRTFHNDGYQIRYNGVGVGDKVEIHPMPWPAAPYITKK